jgi:hypothetical protein
LKNERSILVTFSVSKIALLKTEAVLSSNTGRGVKISKRAIKVAVWAEKLAAGD